MDFLESHAPYRTPPEHVAPRGRPLALALVGVVAACVIVAWEIARPSLPVPFEFAAAARTPGTAAWLGRVPMAAAAVLGLIALYIFVDHTVSRRVAAYAVAVLATTPAWFVHGRTMTGAMLPMACSAGVLAGLGLAVLDPRAGARLRILGIVTALVATLAPVFLARWGIANRGLAVVVGVPALAVGIASVASAVASAGKRISVTAGGLVLALGGGIVLSGVLALFLAPNGPTGTLLLGARCAVPTQATFDAPVAALAYGLVPWTPLLPFAFAARPRSAGHLAILIGAGLAIAAHGLLASRSGPATVVGIASIAAAIAAMLRTLEDRLRPAATLIAGITVLGWLVAHDLGTTPDRVLVAFGASDAALPAAHAAASSLAVRSSVWLCVVLACVALITPRAWLPAGRGAAIVTGGVVAGLVLRVHAYPELLARLSPGAAFDAWASRHRPGEPLGLVGIDKRAVAFAPGTAVVLPTDARSAGAWLADAPRDSLDGREPPRRFLALSRNELPRVNAAYRAGRGINVPVLAGQDGATLLAASALVRGERTENPFDNVVFASAPKMQHELLASLDDRVDVIGWELADDQKRPIEAMPRGSRHAHLRLFLRARQGVTGGYCTFVHIDHSPSRFSAEHRELIYPMSVWSDGDIVVDDFDIKLPAQFRAGSYRIFWGVGVLPCEDDRRMHVTSGPTDGHDRIPGGLLEVR